MLKWFQLCKHWTLENTLCGKITFPFLINFLGFIDCWNSYWLSFNKSTTNISHDSNGSLVYFSHNRKARKDPWVPLFPLEFIVPPLLLSLSDSELWWAAALTSLCHVYSQALRKSDVCVLQGFYMSSDFSSTHTYFFFFDSLVQQNALGWNHCPCVSRLPSGFGKWCLCQPWLRILPQLNSAGFGLFYFSL